ncbi:MAG: AmmeMemoRadiSam system protein B [Propionibacteriaceae bacterium]|jgi:AmmeMemoRadiSam system protein B|nr:AmmeMemoRadiSam system protein B [Propionibacteriaceae bacterium]
MHIRPAAVAGFFYPADPAVLRDTVDGLLAAVPDPRPAPRAVIAPHAGYVYSGSTAALAYATLAGAAFQQIVVLGPCHHVGIRALATPQADAFATPLGEVTVWAEGVRRAEAFEQVVPAAAVHTEEHSLEVQLPFLQRVLPDRPVLPLAVGWVTPEQVAEVIQAFWDPATLIVVSSDLSHYHPYDDARRRDRVTLDQILGLDGPLDHDQACGATPINGLLAAAPALGLQATLLGACNSGDTAGDKRRVVGYAAVAFDAAGEAGAPGGPGGAA